MTILELYHMAPFYISSHILFITAVMYCIFSGSKIESGYNWKNFCWSCDQPGF